MVTVISIQPSLCSVRPIVHSVRRPMPRDIPDPAQPESGPRKRILTKKAREAVITTQATKRVKPTGPAQDTTSKHTRARRTSIKHGKLKQYIALPCIQTPERSLTNCDFTCNSYKQSPKIQPKTTTMIILLRQRPMPRLQRTPILTWCMRLIVNLVTNQISS